MYIICVKLSAAENKNNVAEVWLYFYNRLQNNWSEVRQRFCEKAQIQAVINRQFGKANKLVV